MNYLCLDLVIMLTVGNAYKRCCVGWWRYIVKGISWRGNGEWFCMFGRDDIKRLLLWQLCSFWHTWSTLQFTFLVHPLCVFWVYITENKILHL